MTKKDKKIIDDAERDGIPIFVLTAKDKLVLQTLKKYLDECVTNCDKHHTYGVVDRYFEIQDWQIEHPQLTHYPD
jgi:PHP family Zn ribbon phosphoesterase